MPVESLPYIEYSGAPLFVNFVKLPPNTSIVYISSIP